MCCRIKWNKIKMNTDVYVVDGEGLNIATLRCNIWSLAGRKDIFSLKNKGIKQFAAHSKSKKVEICWSAEKWHPWIQKYMRVFKNVSNRFFKKLLIVFNFFLVYLVSYTFYCTILKVFAEQFEILHYWIQNKLFNQKCYKNP